VVGAPASLGDAESVGDPLFEGEGLPESDGVGVAEPDGLGDPDDGEGDADCGEGDADCGDGEPEGGGDPDCDDGGGLVGGSGSGAWLGGDWLNIRIARRIASIAMRIMISHDARIETRPARS
jgi:hypothetical protein